MAKPLELDLARIYSSNLPDPVVTKKGRSLLGKELIREVHRVFREQGPDLIEHLAAEFPLDFARLIVAITPKPDGPGELESQNQTPLSNLSETQIQAMIDKLDSEISMEDDTASTSYDNQPKAVLEHKPEGDIDG